MTATQHEMDHAEILAEIRQMHGQITRIHGELIAALRIMTAMAANVRDLHDTETNVQAVMAALSQRLASLPGCTQADQSLCPECSAPLTHHRAPAGDLRICTSCGWSHFHAAAPTDITESEAWTK